MALTPLLLAMDVPVGIAGSAVITSLLVTGFVATASNWHRLPRRRALALGTAAIPGALIGAFTWPLVPPFAIGCFLSTVAIVSGGHIFIGSVRAMRRHSSSSSQTEPASDSIAWATEDATVATNGTVQSPPPAAAAAVELAAPTPPSKARASSRGSSSRGSSSVDGQVRPRDALLGSVCGFFSLLTCTGGPFILLPLLFAIEPAIEPAIAVAMAQTLCIPIPACAAIVGALSSSATVDVGLASAIGVVVALGVPLGVRLSHQTDPNHLKLLISACLLVSGGLALQKTARSSGLM